MQVTKTITITEDDILDHFISLAENCSLEKVVDKIETADIKYDIKETGDHDKGTYKQFLENITITY